MKKRTRIRFGIAILAVIVVGVGIAGSVARLRGPEASLPTTKVVRGNVDPKVYANGELRTPNSALLMAPPVGGTLQIVTLAKTGAMVKPGDIVLEFDPSEQEYSLEQAHSQLAQAEQQITKTKADGAVSSANDQVALLHARYDVRRAELDVSQNELKSAIDAKKNDLALEDAHRRLAQLEQDVQSRTASNQANLAVYETQRTKALLDIKQAEDRIQSMTIRATIAGLFSRKGNQDAAGGFFFTGMTLPEFQEGDQTFPGRIIGQILDVSQMEISSQVPEISRADINPGESIEINIDAIPENNFRGKVKTVAGLATGGDWGGDPTRRFDVTFGIDGADGRMRPGQTAKIIVQSEQLKNVLYLPRQALYIKDGKPVVFVKAGRGFEPHKVTVKHTTEALVVVEGLNEGTEVALVNPETAGPHSSTSGNPFGGAAGGKK